MKPLILQLQEDLVTGNKKVQELLRLAKLIAAKLEVGSLEHWIECEITGYPHNEEQFHDSPHQGPLVFPRTGITPISAIRRSQANLQHYFGVGVTS
jgi:hypothetical protein